MKSLLTAQKRLHSVRPSYEYYRSSGRAMSVDVCGAKQRCRRESGRVMYFPRYDGFVQKAYIIEGP